MGRRHGQGRRWHHRPPLRRGAHLQGRPSRRGVRHDRRDRRRARAGPSPARAQGSPGRAVGRVRRAARPDPAPPARAVRGRRRAGDDPGAWDRLEDGRTRVSAAMVDGIDGLLRDLEGHIEMPHEFVVPGETPTSAALEVARTTLRRAERRAVTLGREGLIPGPHLLPYLNRLADLLWVLARAAEQAESRSATPSRPERRRSASTRSQG
ncbi:MAG TPA: ATP:cob(I)alamin adenosyltransferase [Candidatus Limnocylindrales bacterium]|nr:ATP:cob(I)alamin adenosyltransferase [Candidatus Limnocylindrales bacterium]